MNDPGVSARAEPPVDDEATANRKLTGWIVIGGGAASLGVATILNVVARNKMDTCRADWPSQSAMDECDGAKAPAYTSYVMFGLGGAAAVVGLYLLLTPPGGSADMAAREPMISFSPLSDGGLLTASGRY